MFVVYLEICKQTDTQYDYHTLLPTLRGKGNDSIKPKVCKIDQDVTFNTTRPRNSINTF